MFKKYAAIIMAVLIACLAFAACGKKAEEPAPQENTSVTESSENTQNAEEDKNAEFNALMVTILNVKAGSAGTSLRAEEAAKALVEYAYANGAGSTNGAFELLTNEWIAAGNINPADFADCLDAVTAAISEEDMTDVAVLNVINGISAALNHDDNGENTAEAADEGENEEIASLEELNRIFGSALCHPGVMGVTDEAYDVIEVNGAKVAEYRFSVNGVKYSFRASDSLDDITGVTESGDTDYPDENDEPAIKTTANYKLAWWLDGNIQYALVASDAGSLDKDTFEGIAEEMAETAAAIAG